MTIGDRIREHRKKAGLTQKKLGELSGTSETTVKQYELGKRQPRLEQLQKIATALNTSPLVLSGYISEEHDVSMKTNINQDAAFAALLRNIFGHLEEKVVHVDGAGQSYYYVIGDNRKVLNETQYDNLYEAIEVYIKEYVSHFSITEDAEIEYENKILQEVKKNLKIYTENDQFSAVNNIHGTSDKEQRNGDAIMNEDNS